MNENKQIKRKIKLIDRVFQYRLITRFILVNILILIVFGGLIYVFFRSEIAANLASAHAAYRSAADMLLPIILTLSLLNILITSIIIAVVVVYWSHKIAGPLYRFNEALKEMKNGNLNPMSHIREDDQLSEVALSLQQLAEKLGRDIDGTRSRLQELKEFCTGKDLPDEIKDKLVQIENLLKEYRS